MDLGGLLSSWPPSSWSPLLTAPYTSLVLVFRCGFVNVPFSLSPLHGCLQQEAGEHIAYHIVCHGLFSRICFQFVFLMRNIFIK